jgi:two-component system, NtrC family, sensor histidine kinase HydH
MSRVERTPEPELGGTDPSSSGAYPMGSRPAGLELLDALATAVMVVDREGRIDFANARALAVLRMSAAAVLDAPIERILAPFDVLKRAAESGGDEARQSLPLPDSGEVIIGYRAQRMSEPATGVVRYVVVFQDITQWERMREERDRLMRLAAVSEVLPAVLHELKNPLAAIGTAVELLVEDCKEEEFRERLHAVLPEIRRMSLTLEGIGSVGRDLSSVRCGAVDHALRESFKVLERQAHERGISFVCEVPDMPLLPFDVAMIRAIAFNLLTNAIHACPQGKSIRLRAALTQQEPCELRISVEDTGRGMSPDVAARCRELFFTTKTRGSGIGLALCDRAVSATGGTLHVESQLGVGTKVSLSVPVKSPSKHHRR